MTRFKPQEFNEQQKDAHMQFTAKCEELENMMSLTIADSREKSIAMTKLEEFHLWIGKALREVPC